MPTGRGGLSDPQRGYTLLGLLFLLAGLGVAMAALGTLWQTAAQREKERELLFVGDQYRRAIEAFWTMPLPAGTERRLPQRLNELLADPRVPQRVRHLRRLYRDPMTGADEWGLVRELDGGISGIYSLSDDKPFKRAGFAAAYAEFEDAQAYRDWVFRFDVAKAAQGATPAPVAPAVPAPGIAAGAGAPPGTAEAP